MFDGKCVCSNINLILDNTCSIHICFSGGTLTRSGRSQYGVGMTIRHATPQVTPSVAPLAAPPVAPMVPSHYMSSDQLRLAQQPAPPMGNVANPLYGNVSH